MSDGIDHDVASRIDDLFAQMDRRGWDRHLQDDCTLLDDRCCVRGWQQLRASHPLLVQDVELLYGKDFWKRLPVVLRSLIAAFLLTADNTDEQPVAAAARGMKGATQQIEEEKSGRSSADDQAVATAKPLRIRSWMGPPLNETRAGRAAYPAVQRSAWSASRTRPNTSRRSRYWHPATNKKK